MALSNTHNFCGGSKLMSCSYDSEIVQDHMIISKTGLPGKWMGVDKNMEHGINKNKVQSS